jgi:hypothetical protein
MIWAAREPLRSRRKSRRQQQLEKQSTQNKKSVVFIEQTIIDSFTYLYQDNNSKYQDQTMTTAEDVSVAYWDGARPAWDFFASACLFAWFV